LWRLYKDDNLLKRIAEFEFLSRSLNTIVLVSTMSRTIFKITIRVIVLAWYLLPHSTMAIDGDVVYSAPYIMVDPDTGQIVTVNPGPRLKAHEAMPTGGVVDDKVAETNVAAGVNVSVPANQAGQPATLLPITVMYGCLFMVIAGFFIWKSNQLKAKSG
jgi:hypothetical protein